MPEGASTPDEITPTVATEGTRVSEDRDTKEAVLDAFNLAWSDYQSASDDQLRSMGIEPWQRKALQTAQEKAQTEGKEVSYTNEFSNPQTGTNFRQEEGLPVESLIIFLKKKSEDTSLPENDRSKYRDQALILLRNSRSYHQRHRGAEKLVGRVSQEAHFISNDERDTGSQNGDWFKAEEILTNRRELVLPRIRGGAGPTPPGPTPPDIIDHPPPDTVAPPPPDIVEPAPPADVDSPDIVDPPRTPIDVVREHNVWVTRMDPAIRKQAQILTEQRVQYELQKGHALNPLAWARRLGFRRVEEMWRQRYIKHYSKVMLANNSSALRLEISNHGVREVNDRVAEERASGRAKVEQLKIGAQTGKLREGQEVKRARVELNKLMSDEIMRPLVEGTITDPAQVQDLLRQFVRTHENDPQIQAIFGRKKDGQFERLANYFADPEALLETAEAIRQDRAAHAFSLDQLDKIVNFQLASTTWAQETQVKYNAVDRAVTWAKAGRLRGVILNPTVLGASASIATFFGNQGIRRGMAAVGIGIGTATGLAAAPVALGVGIGVGGALTFIERNQTLKSDFGGLGATREAGGQAVTKELVDAQIRQMEGWRGRLMRTPGLARVMGAYRSVDLEKILSKLQPATVDQLRNGGGKELITGDDRKSIDDLLAQDLSQEVNRLAIIRRVTEIDTRLDFSTEQRVGLIHYTDSLQIEPERLLLAQDAARAREAFERACSEAGLTVAEIQTLEKTVSGQWSDRFIETKRDQDRAFWRYRMRNAAGAAIFGGVAGLATALIGQEIVADIQRFKGETPGSTVLENIIKGQPKEEWFQGGRAPGFGNDISRDLYDHAGTEQVSPGVFLHSDGNHHWGLLDSNNDPIDSGNITLDGQTGQILIDRKLENIPDAVKNSFTQDGWGAPHETRLPGFATDYVQDLYTNGGSYEISPGTTLQAIINPDGTRNFNLIDDATNNIIVGQIGADPATGHLNITGFDNLPANVRSVFEQPGWSHTIIDGTKVPGFNLDKVKDFFSNPVAYGGRLGVSQNLRIDIDPELVNGDRQITFHDVTQGGQDVGGPLLWLKPDGKIVVGGDPTALRPDVKNILDSFRSNATNDHNLSYFVEHTLNGPQTVSSDQVVGHGVSVNTWDIKESEFRNTEGPSAIPGMEGLQGLSKDEWVAAHGIKDPVTGEISIKNMSFTFDPREGGERVQITGNLEPNLHQFHFSPTDSISGEGNAQHSSDQIEKALNELTSRGWKVDSAPDGNYLVTLPQATEYTPPTVVDLDPGAARWQTEFSPPPPTSLEQRPLIPLPFAPRHPLEPLEAAVPIPPVTPPYGYGYGGGGRRREGTIVIPEGELDVLGPAEDTLDTDDSGSLPSPSSTTPIAPTSGSSTPSSSSAPTSRGEVPTTPDSGSTRAESIESLQLLLADEVNSPVIEVDRDEAIKRAREFVNSPEVADSAAGGGIDKNIATKLYENILNWFKTRNIVDLEKDDPTLDPALLNSTLEVVSIFYDGESPIMIKKIANIIAKYARENGIVNINSGDRELNLYTLTTLYDKVRNLTLRS